MNVLDLFSGIGGFSLGLERAGMETVAFCEIDPYCQLVLRKHWPEIPIYNDIKTLTAETLSRDGIAVDLICGGFPCQDVSKAGGRKGLDGARSGLWFEFRRLIGELRPQFIIVENTPGLLSLGMGTVLGDLAALRYDAEWHSIPACALGADHERDRVWIVAYPNGHRKLQSKGCKQNKRGWLGNGLEKNVANTNRAGRARGKQTRAHNTDVAWLAKGLRSAFDNANALSREHWDYQPVLGRRVHGVPNRVDRIKALGNAVVPQIPELIGRSIMAACQG